MSRRRWLKEQRESGSDGGDGCMTMNPIVLGRAAVRTVDAPRSEPQCFGHAIAARSALATSTHSARRIAALESQRWDNRLSDRTASTLAGTAAYSCQ